MMSRLERRYRRLLRLLPAWYRADRENEMVSVFLADAGDAPPGADEEDVDELWGEHSWPDSREVAAVAGLAVRTRFGGTGSTGRARAWGNTVRLLGLLGLLANAATSVAGPLRQLATWGRPDGALAGDLLGPATAVDWSNTVAALLGLLWVPAYLLLVLGRRHAARVCVVVAALGSLGNLVYAATAGLPVWLTVPVEVARWLPAVCALLGFHREAPLPRPRPWSLALVAAVLAAAGFALAGIAFPIEFSGQLLGGIVLLIARLTSPYRARASWLIALAILIGFHVLPTGCSWLVHGLPTGFAAAWYTLPTVLLAFVALALLLAITRKPPQNRTA